MMKGCVVYAPFHLPSVQFEVYLKRARAALGEAAWDKVVGYRYLLQGRGSEDVRMLVQSAEFLRNMQADEVRGKVFDVGVDSHRDGVEVLHSAGQLVGKVEGVRFVLSTFSPAVALSLSLGCVGLASLLGGEAGCMGNVCDGEC
jgi:L-rhamnono-1,4-lactonase